MNDKYREEAIILSGCKNINNKNDTIEINNQLLKNCARDGGVGNRREGGGGGG